MGSGKSTIAPLLASKLNYSFVDTDELISSKEGMSIANIFEKKGESYFRQLETSTLNEIILRHSHVISTGGGMGANPNHVLKMKDNGIVIYLKSGFHLLHRRIHGDKERPLAKAKSKKELYQLFHKRRPIYKLALFSVNSNNEPEEVVEKIMAKLKKNGCFNFL